MTPITFPFGKNDMGVCATLRLRPQTDGADDAVFDYHRFRDDEVAFLEVEAGFGYGGRLEAFLGEVVAAIGCEEVAVGIVYAAKGDGVLCFEGIEDTICVFMVVEGERGLDVCRD